MKILLISIALLLFTSSPALASFGFDCQSEDNQISMYIIDYSSMLNIQSINLNGKNIKADKLATNFFLGSVLAIRIMDDQLNDTLLVAELHHNSETYLSYDGLAFYLNSKGEQVTTQLSCVNSEFSE